MIVLLLAILVASVVAAYRAGADADPTRDVGAVASPESAVTDMASESSVCSLIGLHLRAEGVSIGYFFGDTDTLTPCEEAAQRAASRVSAAP